MVLHRGALRTKLVLCLHGDGAGEGVLRVLSPLRMWLGLVMLDVGGWGLGAHGRGWGWTKQSLPVLRKSSAVAFQVVPVASLNEVDMESVPRVGLRGHLGR